MWTPDGVLVELNPDDPQTLFWDRATLYALRGAFRAGAADRAYEKLAAYSRRRLLGAHVPYPVEAYPENDQRHLAAESALYCRIITEGMLGIEPVGLSSFRLSPKLPSAWDEVTLERLALQGREVDVHVVRKGKGYRVHAQLSADGSSLLDARLPFNESIVVE